MANCRPKVAAGRRRADRDAKTKAPAGRRGAEKAFSDAMAKALLVFLGLVLLAAACAGQHGGRAATASAHSTWDDDVGASGDENLQQRQAALKVFSGYNDVDGDPRALKRAVATMNSEMVRMRPVFVAVGRMPEGRAKEEARAAAHELLRRQLA